MNDAVEMIARDLEQGDVIHGQVGNPWKHAIEVCGTPKVSGSTVTFVGDTGRQRQRMALNVESILDVEPSLMR